MFSIFLILVSVGFSKPRFPTTSQRFAPAASVSELSIYNINRISKRKPNSNHSLRYVNPEGALPQPRRPPLRGRDPQKSVQPQAVVALSSGTSRCAIHKTKSALRTSSTSTSRKLQNMARVSPRTSGVSSESSNQSLPVPSSKQHFRESPCYNAQNATDLDHVLGEFNSAEARYTNTTHFR